MEYIRRTSKCNIETNDRTLKFSLKRPVRTHHYLNTYIRLDMKNPKYTLNRIINAFINGYYGRTPHYWERGKYNKAYKLKRNRCDSK